ncbi:MAG: hypothetical protein RL095_2131 [Verrucomicrobiota bacterium]
MKISSIKFVDLMTFYGEQSLKLGDGATVILAPNNSGKTTVIRALEFAFYGANEKTYNSFINIKKFKETPLRKKLKCLVEVDFTDHHRKFKLERWIDFDKAKENQDSLSGESTVRLTEYKDERDTWCLNQDANKLLNKLMSRSTFDFFFFKGEELASSLLTKKDFDFKKNIDSMLYLEQWSDILETLNKVRADAEKSVKLDQENTDRLTKLESDLNFKQNRIEKLKQDLIDCDQNMREEESQLNEWREDRDNLMRSFNQNLQSEHAKCVSQIDKLKKENSALDEENMRLAFKLLIPSLFIKAIPAIEKTFDKLEIKNQVPSEVTEHLLKRLIKDEKCLCDRDLKKGSAPFKHVSNIYEASVTKEINHEIYALKNNLDKNIWAQPVAEAKETIERNEKKIRDNRNSIQDLEEEARELYDQVAKQSDLKGKLELTKDRIDACTRKLRELERDKSTFAYKIESTKSEIDGILREKEVVLSKVKDRTAIDKINSLKSLEALTREWAQKKKDEIPVKFSKFVASSYEAIVNDGSLALIEPNTLRPRITKDNVEVKTGGGQDQVLVISYIMALAKIRKLINEEIRSFVRMQSVSEQIFIMDSIFGQVQGAYQKQLLQYLDEALAQQEIPQLVLLFAGQQWTPEIATILKKSLKRVYGFVLQTPKTDNADDFRFEIFGKQITLINKTDDDSSHTLIQELVGVN